jgi:hypothetical protein
MLTLLQLWIGLDMKASVALEVGTTPLIAALRYPMCSTAQPLLDVGADVNGRCHDGAVWPLFSVAHNLSDEGMAWLLKRGASQTLATPSGRTIVHHLASFRNRATNARGRPITADTAELCCRCLCLILSPAS